MRTLEPTLEQTIDFTLIPTFKETISPSWSIPEIPNDNNNKKKININKINIISISSLFILILLILGIIFYFKKNKTNEEIINLQL